MPNPDTRELDGEIARLPTPVDHYQGLNINTAISLFAAVSLFVAALWGVSRGIEYSGWGIALAGLLVLRTL